MNNVERMNRFYPLARTVRLPRATWPLGLGLALFALWLAIGTAY